MTPPPDSSDAEARVELIQRSLRCFTTGLVGLLPVLGVPFAIVAVSHFFRVKRMAGTQWNPAQDYLAWGLATALSGLFLTIVAVFVIAIIIVEELA